MKIYENFNAIADQFDTLFVDAYGVFWDGTQLIPGSAETLKSQMELKKRVYIISNTSTVNHSYEDKGLVKGIHYTASVTSGDVFHELLTQNTLPFNGNKIYILGISKIDITSNTGFQIVQNLEEADIVYIGTPQIRETELSNYLHLKEQFFPVRNDPKRFDVSTVEPFKEELALILKKKLPVVSTNTDLIVLENGHWVIRQGSVAELYRQMGGEVLEFGKPYNNIYEYAFRKFHLSPSKRIAMIGDTFRTDIKGAINSGLSPVWCLDHGVAHYEQEHGKSIEDQAEGYLDQIYLIHHL